MVVNAVPRDREEKFGAAVFMVIIGAVAILA